MHKLSRFGLALSASLMLLTGAAHAQNKTFNIWWMEDPASSENITWTKALADLDNERMILYPNAPVPGLAEEVAAAFRDEGVTLRVEQEVEDVVTSMALVASRFGICVTTESAANLRLPGVVYRPLKSRRLRAIELNCMYRRDDESPILAAFLALIRHSRTRRHALAM